MRSYSPGSRFLMIAAVAFGLSALLVFAQSPSGCEKLPDHGKLRAARPLAERSPIQCVAAKGARV